MATDLFESADGKPVLLAAILTPDDVARVRAALKATPRLVDETAARLAPAHIWGTWLDELGLPDLADRVRSEMASTTRAGDYLLTVGLTGRAMSPLRGNDGH